MKRSVRAGDLFDFLVDRGSKGANVHEMAAHLKCPRRSTDQAIHDLRTILGDTQDVNLVAEPEIAGEPWVYRLTGDLATARFWITNRLRDSETRLRTEQAVMLSVARATDGRTSEGKRARITEQALRHLIEDLEMLGDL